MIKITLSSLILTCLLLTVGCSVKQPKDTSDPKASAAWIDYCLKQATKSPGNTAKISWQQKAYVHATELKAASHPECMDKVNFIPGMVAIEAIASKNLEAFEWALNNGAEPGTHYQELTTFWELGKHWRDLVITAKPEALPVFMSEAIDGYNVKFFNAYAEEFSKSGFIIKPPLETTEFNIRYRRFIGEQLEEALAKKDDERIAFLISQIPKVESPAHLDVRTHDRVKQIGDYLIQENQNEVLAGKLIRLGFELNKPDLENGSFSAEFLQTLRENPDYAVKALQLAEWNGPLSDAEVKFLLTLPEETWKLLHDLHIDETIEICLKLEKTNEAMLFIQLRAERTPLTRSAYNLLMNWSLKYGNKIVFDFVMEQNGEIDIYSIDFGALAYNQKLFEHYAPKIMNKVYYTMDTAPHTDGTTFGHIYDVFACKSNEKAGLYLVSRYDLSEAWVKATDGRTLLMDVCRAGNLLTARYLLEKRTENIHAATGYSELQISMFGRNRPTEGKLSAIFFAAKSGNSDLIKYLRSKGANVNARSNFHTTPLMHAVTAGHLDAVKTLIELDANVNYKMDPNINAMDLREMGSFNDIVSPYRRAESSGRKDILEVLEQAGAHP